MVYVGLVCEEGRRRGGARLTCCSISELDRSATFLPAINEWRAYRVFKACDWMVGCGELVKRAEPGEHLNLTTAIHPSKRCGRVHMQGGSLFRQSYREHTLNSVTV